jgi:hypothetical protein
MMNEEKYRRGLGIRSSVSKEERIFCFGEYSRRGCLRKTGVDMEEINGGRVG